MNKVFLRSAKLNDLDKLLRFEQEIILTERKFDNTLKSKEVTYYDIKELILSNNAEVVVIESNGTIVGSGYAKIVNSKSYLCHEQHSYLGFMYIEPEYRGNEYNKKILNYLIDWSKNMGIKYTTLEVYEENESAINAYKKIGFKKNLVEMKMKI